jgi:hypothetical protein
MRGILQEAHELVDWGLMSSEDFRRFSLENVVRLHGGMNKNFFKGTRVETEAEKILDTEKAHNDRAEDPAPAHSLR